MLLPPALARAYDIATVDAAGQIAIGDNDAGVALCRIEGERLLFVKTLIQPGWEAYTIPHATRVTSDGRRVAAYDWSSRTIVVVGLDGTRVAFQREARTLEETTDIVLRGDDLYRMGPVWSGRLFNPDGVAATQLSIAGSFEVARPLHLIKGPSARIDFARFSAMQEAGVAVTPDGGYWVVVSAEAAAFRYDAAGARRATIPLPEAMRVSLEDETMRMLFHDYAARAHFLCDRMLVEGVGAVGEELLLLARTSTGGGMLWMLGRSGGGDLRWATIAAPEWADCFTRARLDNGPAGAFVLFRYTATDDAKAALYRYSLDGLP